MAFLPACRVQPSGDMCIFPGDLRSPEANKLYHKVALFSREVHEYLTAIERAPVLKATALDEDFRLLAEWGDAVLAGRETEYGYMFVTWKRDCEGTGVCGGRYRLGCYVLRRGSAEQALLDSADAHQDGQTLGGMRME